LACRSFDHRPSRLGVCLCDVRNCVSRIRDRPRMGSPTRPLIVRRQLIFRFILTVAPSRSYIFYRAKLRVARYCHCQGKLSVRPSVTLRYRDHIGGNCWKIILRLISLFFSLSAEPDTTDLLQREHPLGRVAKIVDFRHLSRRISETAQDSFQVAIDH